MSRHRSPRGRGAHQHPLVVAPGRRRAGAGAPWSVPTPLQRGAAAVAVTGGAFSLIAAASPAPAVLPVAQTGPAQTDPVETEPVEAHAMVLQSAVEPVDPEPEPDVLDAGELVKAVQIAEQQLAQVAAAAQEAATDAVQDATQQVAEAAVAAVAPGSGDCGMDTSDLGRVKSHVRTAAEELGCRFGEPDMHGVAGRAGTSDHPSGLAVDFMVSRSTGDSLAACALRNMDELGIKYVIWEQRINHGNGWKRMEDRGGATANHFDHVHISFDRNGRGGSPQGC